MVPRSDSDEELLRRLLDASAALWNQLTYERRQNFTDPDIDKSVWETEDYRKQYVGVLGSATAQQVIRKNTEAWRSFFALKEKSEANGLLGQRRRGTGVADIHPKRSVHAPLGRPFDH
jgi:putative transposase